jgi:hypothetical protein
MRMNGMKLNETVSACYDGLDNVTNKAACFVISDSVLGTYRENVEVKVTLRLMVSQSVSLFWCRKPLWGP